MAHPKVVKHLAYSAVFLKKGKFLSGHSGGGPGKSAPCDGYLISFSTAELEKNSESLAFQDSVFLPIRLLSMDSANVPEGSLRSTNTTDDFKDLIALDKILRACAKGKRSKKARKGKG